MYNYFLVIRLKFKTAYQDRQAKKKSRKVSFSKAQQNDKSKS